MKRIINLIYLTILLFSNKVMLEANQNNDLTKPIICIEGTNYQEYLNYEGYNIIENNVNFNVPGKYHITYENKNNERFIKNVDIISRQNLNDLAYYQITKKDFDENNTYNWESIMAQSTVNEYTYQVVSYFNTENEQSIEYLNLFYNNNLVKQTNLSSNEEIRIKKIIVTSTNIYLVGMKKYQSSNYDVYVAQYTLDIEYIRDFCIFGNKYDEVKDALIIDEYMYVIGITSSNDGYYSSNIDQDVFIFKIDYTLGIVRKSYLSNITSSETVTNLVYLDNSLYYGYSFLNNGQKNVRVKKVNLNFEEITYIDYGYRIGIDIKKIATDNINLYVLMSYNDYDLNRSIVVLNIVSKNFAYVKQHIYKYIDYNYVRPIDIVINESNIVSLLFQISNKNNVPGYSVIKLKDNQEILNVIQVNDEYPTRFINDNGNNIYTSKQNQLNIQSINSIIVFRYWNNYKTML